MRVEFPPIFLVVGSFITIFSISSIAVILGLFFESWIPPLSWLILTLSPMGYVIYRREEAFIRFLQNPKSLLDTDVQREAIYYLTEKFSKMRKIEKA